MHVKYMLSLINLKTYVCMPYTDAVFSMACLRAQSLGLRVVVCSARIGRGVRAAKEDRR